MKKIFLCFSLFIATESTFAQQSSFILPDRLAFSLSPSINANYEGLDYFSPSGVALSYEYMLRKNLSFTTGLRYFRGINDDEEWENPTVNPTLLHFNQHSLNSSNVYDNYLSLSFGFKIYDVHGKTPFFLDIGAAPVTNFSLDNNDNSFFSAYLGTGFIFKYSKKLFGTIEPIYYYPLTSNGYGVWGTFALNIGIGMKI